MEVLTSRRGDIRTFWDSPLRELVRIAQSDSRIGILGPAFLGWDDNEPNHYMVGNHPDAIDTMKAKSPEPMDVDWVEGSFLMVSRRCVEEVGPLDPYLFFYWEETDFCRRARYQEWRVVLVPSALARHYSGGSSKGDPENTRIMNCLQSRNYYIYKLANPFQGFPRNVKDAAHLFFVNAKVRQRVSLFSLISEIRVFGKIICDTPAIYKKWVRDRQGNHPPITTDEFKFVHPEIMPQASVKIANHFI